MAIDHWRQRNEWLAVVTQALRGKAVIGVLTVTAIALLAWGALIPWEWSYVDEPGFALNNSATVSQYGIPGLVNSAWDTHWSFANGGRFRPAYIAFVHSYLFLGPALAHVGRLLMLLASVGTLIVLARRGAHPHRLGAVGTVWLVALFCANYTLFDGAYWVNLSELTGVFLVSLGLLSRNLYVTGFLFLLASLGKEPFVWLVIAFGVTAFIADRRKAGTIITAAGIANLAIVLYFARYGSYTAGALESSLGDLLSSPRPLVRALLPWLVMLGVGAFALKVKWRANPLSIGLLAGGIGYILTISAWGANGYLIGPVAFLFTASIASGVKNVKTRFTAPWFRKALVSMLVIISSLSVAWSLDKAVARNALVVGVQEWLVLTMREGNVLAVNQSEAPTRIAQINELRGGNQPVKTIEWGRGQADFVLVLNDFAVPADLPRCSPIVSWRMGYIIPTAC